MSLFDYRASQHPALMQAPFYALIMAAMRGADSYNIAKLREAWPEVWAETYERYHAPGGLIDGEQVPATNGGETT